MVKQPPLLIYHTTILHLAGKIGPANSLGQHFPNLLNPKWIIWIFSTFMLLLVGLEEGIGFNSVLDTGLSFDSNVFRTSERSAGDFFLTFAPALSVQRSFSRAFLKLDSRFVWDRYYRYTQVNARQTILNGQVRYNLSSHLSFEVNDELAKVQNLRPSTVRGTITPLTYLSNRASPALKYERSNGMAITVEYSNESRSFTDSSNLEWNTNGMKLSLLYPLGYRTTAQLLFGFKHKVFGSDVAYRSESVAIELSRKLSSRFNVSTQLGWENRTYRSGGNIDSLLVDINITGELFRKIPMTLNFRRPLTDSDIYAGRALIPLGTALSLSWDLTSHLQLKVEGDIGRNIYPGFRPSDVRYFGRGQVGYKMRTLGTIYFTYARELINPQSRDEGFRQGQFGISFVRPVPLFSQ